MSTWGCQICGHTSFDMTEAEHAKLGCQARYRAWNRAQFELLKAARPELTEGAAPW